MSQLRRLLPLTEGTKPRYWVALVVLALLASVLELLAAYAIFALLSLVATPDQEVVIPVLDVALAASGEERSVRLLWLAVTVAVAFVVRGVVVLVQNYGLNRLAHNTAARLASKLLRRYVHVPYEEYAGTDPSKLARTVHDAAGDAVGLGLVPAVSMASELLLSFSLLVVLALEAPLATLVAVLLLGPVLIVLARIVQPRLERLGRVNQEMKSHSLKYLAEAFAGLRDIRIAAAEERFVNNYRRIRTQLARTIYLRAWLLEVPRIVLETSVVLFILGFIGISALRGDTSAETLAVLGLFGYAALRVLPSVNRIVAYGNQMRFGRAAVDDVVDDLARTSAWLPDEGSAAHRTAPLPFARSIRLVDVSVAFEDRGDRALEQVNVEVPRGQRVAIVGSTGSGKSTLLDVLCGLLPPTGGRVEVDGADVNDHRRGWQANVGLVSQSIFLMDDTLRRNIAFGVEDDDIDDEQIQHVLELAQLDDFVGQLPEGLETRVGDRGVRLSGGQRQRIAIARALYPDPRVLVLDEGTSALDALTERRILDSLQTVDSDRTLVVVSHRLGILRQFDTIFLLRDGRMAATGTFDDLLRRSRIFGELVESGT